MQIVRTLVWIILLIAFVALTVLNWDTQLAVRIWPGIVWDTRLPAVIVVAFIFGLVPMWLIYRGSLWRHRRRISSLESSLRTAAVPPPAPANPPPPVATAELAPEVATPPPPPPPAGPTPG